MCNTRIIQLDYLVFDHLTRSLKFDRTETSRIPSSILVLISLLREVLYYLLGMPSNKTCLCITKSSFKIRLLSIWGLFWNVMNKRYIQRRSINPIQSSTVTNIHVYWNLIQQDFMVLVKVYLSCVKVHCKGDVLNRLYFSIQIRKRWYHDR